MSNKDYKSRFIKLLLDTYKTHKMEDKNYEMVEQMLLNQYQQDDDKVKYETLLQILKDYRDGIDIGSINNQTVGRKIYNMSDMINYDLIKKYNNKIAMKYVPDEASDSDNENPIYLDSLGRKLQIKKTGTLYFEQWNGVIDYVDEYLIKMLESNNSNIEYKIFSNINMYRMSSQEYKDAVLDELLNRNNIKLSNVGGYVGEIEANTDQDKNSTEQEHETENGYSYKINDSYKLVYDPAKATITKMYSQIEKNNVKSNESDENERE